MDEGWVQREKLQQKVLYTTMSENATELHLMAALRYRNSNASRKKQMGDYFSTLHMLLKRATRVLLSAQRTHLSLLWL